MKSNLKEKGLGITRDAIAASGGDKEEYGHVPIGLHWEECGHPDQGSCRPSSLGTGVTTPGIVCPGVGLPILEEWQETGDDPEQVCQDGARGHVWGG